MHTRMTTTGTFATPDRMAASVTGLPHIVYVSREAELYHTSLKPPDTFGYVVATPGDSYDTILDRIKRLAG